jgi:hypothetical protein
MPQPPKNDVYYQDAEVISQLVRDFMLPDLPLLNSIPFTIVDQKTIIAKRQSYTVDTDPSKKEISQGDTVLGAWPTITLTYGDAVNLNTSMRKTRAEFTNDDLALATFQQDVMKCYTSAAWTIADQINASLVTAMKAGKLAQTTKFDADVAAWSGNADPIGDIRNIARDISVNKGYELDTVIVNVENYDEMWDHLEASDQDLDYLRSQIPERGFYKRIAYLKTPGVWVVGVTDDTGLTTGQILGLGKYQSNPCVENLAYYDPQFGNRQVADGEIQGLSSANLPLNVNPYSMPDNRTSMVEMWIDSVPNVANGYGVFYKSSGI